MILINEASQVDGCVNVEEQNESGYDEIFFRGGRRERTEQGGMCQAINAPGQHVALQNHWRHKGHGRCVGDAQSSIKLANTPRRRLG